MSKEETKQVKMVQSEKELDCYSEKLDKEDEKELDVLLEAEEKKLDK